ncbi:peptide chain release factor 3 [Brevibacillus humidisoli]|uniref:peptide chain release factor 3 n=1 Tax=Brevibacillus humidisoli TaxID=2895522 RepID=UPI001E3D2B0E|nr:peptide chain release factor 3 [Brevibacillus humidisoli]UFJ43003.1 peptide chain release factor 3 [Brevibacillus humidisoli]
MSTEQAKWKEEIAKRRTFAIISHPDAGKTTMTEKLLYYGGAIREAGMVKARKNSKFATSDWMEIEKKRGISVTSSAMEFSYKGHHINILDTPGHEDFSEDTYRTLTAADAAVMIIDAAKGVEAQTIKLFKVCRMRGIPIFTFINKLDRHGKDPFELLEELERVLGIRSYPMNWPIGMGSHLCGVYDRQKSRVELYEEGSDHREISFVEVSGPDDPRIGERVGSSLCEQLQEEVGLLDVAGDAYDAELIDKGELTPVFFGSAINNFGVQTFLDNFLSMAPAPSAKRSSIGPIDPYTRPFSGFIFKIQANMNPAHRDRVAFLRICSGRFERGMAVRHVRLGREIKLSQPLQFMAQDRAIVEESYAGDVIGLFDPGIFQIGDTLCIGESFEYEEMPHFSPEFFAKVTVKDAMKHKQFQKGIAQLTEEGTVQLFRTYPMEELIVGVVGVLQFEVLEHRLRAEYGVEILMQRLSYQIARWLDGDKATIDKLLNRSQTMRDRYNRPVMLFESEYQLRMAQEKYPDLAFHESSLGLKAAPV